MAVRLKSMLEQREEADHLGGVEDERRDGADGEMPFEAPPDVDQHRQHAESTTARTPDCASSPLTFGPTTSVRSKLASGIELQHGRLAAARGLRVCASSPPACRWTRMRTVVAVADFLQRDLAEVRARPACSRRARQIGRRLGGRPRPGCRP